VVSGFVVLAGLEPFVAAIVTRDVVVDEQVCYVKMLITANRTNRRRAGAGMAFFSKTLRPFFEVVR